MLSRKTLTKEQVLQKARHFCRYQERCHFEVIQKLYTYRLPKRTVDEILAQLIAEDYLNEERFAIMYAGGKFRIKTWGRLKIRYELKQKRISEYCIMRACAEIDETQYRKILTQLAEKKWNSVDEKSVFVKFSKTSEYLKKKGYEPLLVKTVLNNLKESSQ